jgi:DUF971 family protein
MHPREITIGEAGRELVIEWADRSISRIPGRSLRNACACCRCLADRPGSRRSLVSLRHLEEGGSRIVSVDLPSSNSISIGWGDLHNVSFFRFSDLIKLFPPIREGGGIE